MGRVNATALVIYNLFPRLISFLPFWEKHLERIASMGFNSIYVNPFQLTGASRSLYAVKDYYTLNPEFLPDGFNTSDFTPVKSFVKKCEKYNIAVIMDLVLNHTANESDLIKEYPQWFKRDNYGNIVHPYAIDPANPSNVTVWGDLSEIDYEHTPDMSGLRLYWDKIISFYQDLGVSGFRCDAAYKVPCEVYHPLIDLARNRHPGTLFLAETLGCTLEQVQHLRSCGFDYLFNSCKWWNFDNQWCLDQHSQFKNIAPSIGFPESHDTGRTSSGQPGSLNWQKNRYVLACVFSKGIMMPIGYETGATKKIDVVNSVPDDLKNGKWDITSWIAKVNKLKLDSDLLCQEGNWRSLWGYDSNVLFLLHENDNYSRRMGFLVNKDWYNKSIITEDIIPAEINAFSYRIFPFNDPEKKVFNRGTLTLEPSEIVLFFDGPVN
jgi:starch synthase (maltosyl-transferring)